MKDRKPLCLDYDGMGDFSRFPSSEKNVKKSFDITDFFRIFVSNKSQKSTKNSVSWYLYKV